MLPSIERLVDLAQFPLRDEAVRARCKQSLDDAGALVLPRFLTTQAVASVPREGEQHRHRANCTANTHNIFLKPTDPQFPDQRPGNRAVASSRGCITTDQMPEGSALHVLYAAQAFRDFLCAVPVQTLAMEAGVLVPFRGRNAMHREAPVQGRRTRMLAVLAYYTEPGISLSEPARMTFYGRLGNGPAALSPA